MLNAISEKALRINDKLLVDRVVEIKTRPAINVVSPDEIAKLVERVVTAESNAAKFQREAELMRSEMVRNRRETLVARESHTELLTNYEDVCNKLATIKKALT